MGQNYPDHAKEMGHAPDELPLFFMKPGSAIVPEGGEFPYPTLSENVHYEFEAGGAAIGKGGSNIRKEDALGHASTVTLPDWI